MRLVVLGHVTLVLSSVRGRPRPSLVRVKTPTNPIVFARILIPCDISVDLVHSFDDHSYVIGFRHGGERRSGRSGVAGEHRSGASPVDVVGRVTDRSDPGQVGVPTTAKDRVFDLLPESSFVKELKAAVVSAIDPKRNHSAVGVLTATLQA